MVNNRFIHLFLILFISVTAGAQSISEVNSPVKKGPKGVYFLAVNPLAQKKTDTDVYKKYKQMEGQFSYDNKSFKTVTVLSQPVNYQELERRIGTQEIAQLKNGFGVQNGDSLLHKMSKVDYKTIFYYLNKDFSLAMGFTGYAAYEKRTPLAYRLLGKTENGQTEIIYTILEDNIPMKELPKAILGKNLINDSMVTLKWKVPGKYAQRAIFASLYKMEDNIFKKVPGYILGNNQDSVIEYNYTDSVAPDNFYKYYITVEDYGGFSGPPSDTASMLAVSSRQMRSIKNFTLKDSAGSVHLNWNGIPDKGYFSAIEVSKSRNALNDFVVLDTIPITDTTYDDLGIVAGTQYYYSIKAIAYPFTYIKALPSATANINIENKSSKPFAPTAFSAINEDKNIRLSWEDNPELDLYAYFVYRGTNENNMEQVSGIVQGNTWLDSSATLSGLTTYAYAIKVMNRGQMMSDASKATFIKPARATTVPAIGGLTGLKKDAGYQLQWENIADNYTSVTGYILLRKAGNEKEFFPVAHQIIEDAVYTDSSQLIPGIKYEYAVAAIDYNGSVGQLSPSVYYEPKNTNLKPPSSFTAFIDNGKIKIKWPDEASKSLNKKINIYRKSSAEKTFKLIGTSGSNDFTDEKTVSKMLYTYSLSVSLNNIESEKSITQSVRAK
ncbi:MAG: hypothetical protein ABIP30_17240 [Ferruginibacter sp.]